MNLRATIRRARAVAALYLSAYIDAEMDYKNKSDTPGHRDRLHVLGRYRDALEHIVSAIGSWHGYPLLREGTTLGRDIADHGAGLESERAAWLEAVGEDVDARIADPKGTRKRPLPVPKC